MQEPGIPIFYANVYTRFEQDENIKYSTFAKSNSIYVGCYLLALKIRICRKCKKFFLDTFIPAILPSRCGSDPDH